MEIIKDRFKNFKEYKKFYENLEISELSVAEIPLFSDRTALEYAYKNTPEEQKGTLERLLFVNKVLTESDGSIFDIGCHTGILSLGYAIKGRRVVGIDISKGVIEFCNEILKQTSAIDYKYIASSYEEFKIDEKFDYVIVAEILEHVLEPDKLLDYAEKHCKGQVIITTPKYEGVFGYNNPGDTDHQHIRAYKEKELEELISKRGEITGKGVSEILMISYKPNVS